MRNHRDIAVIIPSYREDKNIEILLKQINIYLPGAKVFIVDDSNIQDNRKIGEIVARYKNAKLISRFIKMGRGSAVIAGFKEALKDKNINYCFEMDSDLAHYPGEIPRFLDKIKEKKFDVIIGSRYIKNGKTINIVISRIILSRIINLFLRMWLSIKLTDFTGGFRIYNRKSIEFLSNIKLRAKGFIMLSETIYLLHRNNFKIGEVPITVSIKKDGKSNADVKEFTDSLFFVIKMRLENTFFSRLPWK